MEDQSDTLWTKFEKYQTAVFSLKKYYRLRKANFRNHFDMSELCLWRQPYISPISRVIRLVNFEYQWVNYVVMSLYLKFLNFFVKKYFRTEPLILLGSRKHKMVLAV